MTQTHTTTGASATTVLMATDTVGGVWTYSLDLVDALAARGVNVVLVTLGPPPSAVQRASLERSAVTASFDLGHPLEWMDDPWAGVDAAGGQLLELVMRARAAGIDPEQAMRDANQLLVQAIEEAESR